MGTSSVPLIVSSLLAAAIAAIVVNAIYRLRKRDLPKYGERLGGTRGRRKADEEIKQLARKLLRQWREKAMSGNQGANKQKEVQVRVKGDGKRPLDEEGRKFGYDFRIDLKEEPEVDTGHQFEEEKPHSEAAQGETTKDVETRGLEPGGRGGRPRGPTQCRGLSQDGKSLHLKHEIVCWKRERQWILGVELPDDVLAQSDLTVKQNGLFLVRDESKAGCWRLEQSFGQVEVYWEEDAVHKRTKITLGEDRYLLFKLHGPSRGRTVKFPSFGSYLVITPDKWERDENLSSFPAAAPDPVSIQGHQGHHFDFEKGTGKQIVFKRPDGLPVFINQNVAPFEVVGTQLNDAGENGGPLFGEKPPQIRAIHEEMWKNISTIVVGEEGPGKGRWRRAFTPMLGLTDQSLPSDLAARTGGWYFLRFYDKNNDLLESLDFRFMGKLKNIKVHQPSPLPLDSGHTPVSVEFYREPDCGVQPADPFEGTVSAEHEDDKTILTVPPEPRSDRSRWLVGPQAGPKVEVTILVERIWWALGQEDAEPSEWVDRPVTLQLDHFAATSKATLWLRLPTRRWTRELVIGFERPRARNYKPKVTEEKLAILLRDFGDVEELRSLGRSELKLWVSSRGGIQTGVLGEVVVKLLCKCCGFSTAEKIEMFSHVESHHITEFIRPLTYEEMRVLIPSLPPGIYKCPYCGFYARSDDPKSPTSAITKHQEEECSEAREEASRRRGAVRIRIHPIFDIEEIRDNVINNLPRIYRCTLCRLEFHDPAEGDEILHLTAQHENMLYDVR